jgi:hypothetical protein
LKRVIYALEFSPISTDLRTDALAADAPERHSTSIAKTHNFPAGL